MDPLSVAASAAGLISLAAQVTNLAWKIREDIKLYSPNGKGLERLSAILEHVARMCSQTEFILGLGLGGSGDAPAQGNRGVAADIGNALAYTNGILESVRAEVVMFKQLTPAKRAALVFQRKLKGEKLDDLERQLDDSLSRLRDFIQLHHWKMSWVGDAAESRPEIPTAITLAVQPTHVSTSTVVEDGEDKTLATRRREHKNVTIARSRFIGAVHQKTLQTLPYSQRGEPQLVVETTRSISLELHYLSSYLEAQYRWGLYIPVSFSLRTLHQMDQSLEMRVRSTMREGTLRDLQDLLVSGEISLYSRSNLGGSLFHLAAASLRPEKCRFLLTQDSTGELLQDCPPYSSTSYGHIGDYQDFISSNYQDFVSANYQDFVFDMMQAPKQSTLDLRECRYLLSMSLCPFEIRRCFDKLARFAPESAFEIADAAWTHVVVSIRAHGERGLEEKRNGWVALIQRLVQNGVGSSVFFPNQQLFALDDTPYPTLLYMLTPPECLHLTADRVKFWLELLDSCGVDMKAYLARQLSLCRSHPNAEPDLALLPSKYGELPSLSSEWRLDPVSHAHEVCAEFKDLAACGVRYWWGTGGPHLQHADWKVPFQTDINWPFIWRPDLMGLGGEHRELGEQDAWHRAVRLQKERFERRQSRRQPASRVAIPGAWID